MGHYAQFEDEGEGADDSKGAAKILKEAQDGAEGEHGSKEGTVELADGEESVCRGDAGGEEDGEVQPGRRRGAAARRDSSVPAGPERDSGHVDEEGFPGDGGVNEIGGIRSRMVTFLAGIAELIKVMHFYGRGGGAEAQRSEAWAKCGRCWQEVPGEKHGRTVSRREREERTEECEESGKR